MEQLPILKKEHEEIRNILVALECLIENNPTIYKVKEILNKLGEMWDVHEKREEAAFEFFEKEGIEMPFKTMFIAEHREFKGHWKVLNKYVSSSHAKILNVALETDGRMLIDKFRKHMALEEIFFNKISSKDNKL